MFVFQVLDLYSQPTVEAAPESPPLQSRPVAALEQGKTSKSSNGQDKPDTPVESNTPTKVTALPPDVPQFPYQTFTGAPPHMPPFPPAYTAPLPGASTAHLPAPPPGAPHIPAPPVYSPYVAPPPHFPAVVPAAAAYYQPPAPGQQHRAYYPPT